MRASLREVLPDRKFSLTPALSHGERELCMAALGVLDAIVRRASWLEFHESIRTVPLQFPLPGGREKRIEDCDPTNNFGMHPDRPRAGEVSCN